MKVYVAEADVYSSRYLVGVYDSAERAMGALPNEGTWVQTIREGESHWDNSLDFSESITITEFELTDAGPLRSPTIIRRGTPDANGRWHWKETRITA